MKTNGVERTAGAVSATRQAGFSLLELLVALIVVVLITSMVTLTVSSGGQDVLLAASVRNLADVAEYALDEAQMTGTDYGLRLEEEIGDDGRYYSYSWRERRIEGWFVPSAREEIFAPRTFPVEIDVELELKDSPLRNFSLDEDENENENENEEESEDENEEASGKKTSNPQVVFYASGEATVGAINVRQRDSGDLLWRIEWDLLGRFKLLPKGEEILEDVK